MTCPRPPVRPVPLTGQTGPHKTEGLHTLPASVQPADFLAYWSRSTTSHPSASRRINLTQQGQKSTSGCLEIKIGGNKPWATNTPQDLPDQWVYLAHIPRHARYLAGGLFCRKATKVIPYFQLLAPYSICLNHRLVFASPKQPYQT